MGLKETIKNMNDLLCKMVIDLEKSERGNKTASQRVRTASINFSKIAKKYRKESIEEEKRLNNKSTKSNKKIIKKVSKKKNSKN